MTAESPIPPLRPVETIPVKQDGQDYVVLRDPQGFSDGMIAVAMGALPILARLDGQLSALDITAIMRDEYGLEVDPDQIVSIVEMLEKSYLLQSDAFLKHRRAMEDEYREADVREPILMGGGYPSDPDDLVELLETLEASEPDEDFGPEKPLKGKRLRGLMVPHIDYHRGGKSYGRLYKQVRALLPDPGEGPLLVGLIGVAHHGAFEPIVTTAKDYITPFGTMKYDRDAMELLRDRLGDKVVREEYIHKHEHSVEIQVPWLQYLLKDHEVTFLPLLAGILDAFGNGDGPIASEKVDAALNALRLVEENHPGPVLWLASVDFAHVGPQFGDPATVSDKDCSLVERRDMKALETVQKADASAWWDELMSDGNQRRVCGVNATYLLLNLMSGTRGRVIDYQQSVSEDRNILVSYAAALFQDA
ncbi:AmmeMemoRadiSam system protein B [bacterium]|nr:AmmeMemoRadiSam system protein B [bacterium]